jgi:hypothetical protein
MKTLTLATLHNRVTSRQPTLAVPSRRNPMPQGGIAGTSSLTSSRKAAGVPTLAVRSRNNIMA